LLKKLLGSLIVTAATSGSVRYYSEVLNNEGLLRIFREGDPNTGPSFPILAVLDGVEISEIDLGPGSNHP
jgi:hypothetical protein